MALTSTIDATGYNRDQIGAGDTVSVNGDSIGLYYGTVPVAQAATIAAVATTGATTELAAVETAVNSVILALKNIGIVAAA